MDSALLPIMAILPFLGALVPGLMIRAGRNACATFTAVPTLLALVFLGLMAPAVFRGEVFVIGGYDGHTYDGRNDLPTVDNKERERQKLKQVIKDHHQERRADYRAKRDARLEREAEMERQKNHRLNLTNSAAVRGAAVAREERAAQHRGFKEAALKRRQKQMPD